MLLRYMSLLYVVLTLSLKLRFTLTTTSPCSMMLAPSSRGTCWISNMSSPTLSSRRTQRLKRQPMQSIHITTLRKILSSPELIDIRLWTRSGEIQSWHRCISLKYDFYKGTRRMKLLDSNEIRQLRDVCIFEVNGIKVYM